MVYLTVSIFQSCFFFFQAEDGIRDLTVTGVQTCALPISIEDSSGDAANPLRSIEEAVARLRAARAAIDEAGGGTLLVGRAENFFVGRPDPDDTKIGRASCRERV